MARIFADTAALNAATPATLGQLAFTADTGQMYIGTALSPGGWNATNADNANTCNQAQNAGFATIAASATNADHATNADTATDASNAGFANSCVDAENAGNTGTLFFGSGTPMTPANHIATSGDPTPAITAAGGAGTGATVSIAGDDSTGLVTITTGVLPTAAAAAATITFSNSYTRAPRIFLAPANASAAALSGASAPYAASSTTDFAINTGTTALIAAVTYIWRYFAIEPGS